MTYYLVRNDTGSQIRAVLTRQDTGEVVPVSNASVLLKFRAKNTTITLFSVSGIGSVEDLDLGVVTFPLGNNLDLTPGMYEGEIEVTYNSGEVESVFELLNFKIREDF